MHARTEEWWSEPSAIYADCTDKVVSIRSVSFNHVPREVNQVSHVLASQCFSTELSCNWIDESSSFISDKLVNDVTII
jgi:hypothetical protein